MYSVIEWYILDPEEPEEKIELEKDYQFERSANKITVMSYNHNFEKIYIATEGGELFLFPVKAESTLEDEEEQEEAGDKDDDENQEEEKIVFAEVQDITTSHSAGVTFLKEIPNSTYLISAGLDGKVQIWDGFESRLLGNFVSDSDLTCGDLSPDTKLLVVGTTASCLKFLDMTNRARPKLIDMRRIYENDINITQVSFSPDGKLIAACGHSKFLYILYGTPEKRWRVLGKIEYQYEIGHFAWSKAGKIPGGGLGIIVINEISSERV